MGVYQDYINNILPVYLNTPNGRAFEDAFSASADDLSLYASLLRAESMLLECDNDILPLHFKNRNLCYLRTESFAQQREYLRGVFEKIWNPSGSVLKLQEELARLGFKNTRIITWADLVTIYKVPSAFGGNLQLVMGLDANGGMYYLKRRVDLNVIVQHINNGPNQSLEVVVGSIPTARVVSIQLATDGTSFPISRPVEIAEALEKAGCYDYLFFAAQGTGLGTATASAPYILPNVFYTYFIIDLYDAHTISKPIVWNDPANTVTGPPASVGPSFGAWKKFSPQPPFSGSNSGNIESVFATSRSNIWIRMDNENVLRRWNGTAWESVAVMGMDADDNGNKMFGTDEKNIVLALSNPLTGPGGYVMRWDGATWSRSDLPLSDPANYFTGLGVWGTNAINMWVCGKEEGASPKPAIFFWDGFSWTSQTLPALPMNSTLSSIWGSSVTDVWVVSQSAVGPRLLRWNGTAWSIVTGPSYGANEFPSRIWGTSISNIWITGGGPGSSSGRLWRWNGTTWSAVTLPANTYQLGEMTGTGANNVYFLGFNDQYVYWDGSTYKLYDGPVLPDSSGNNFLLYGSPIGIDGFVFCSSSGLFIYQDWVDCTTTPKTMPVLNATGPIKLHGLRADYIWATVATGQVALYDGVSWSVKTLPVNKKINSIFCLDENNVWFVGDQGAGVRWNGSAFQNYPLDSTINYHKVWAGKSDDVYAVGDLATVSQFTGSSWSDSTITFPGAVTPPKLTALYGTTRTFLPAVLVIAGEGGRLCMYDAFSGSTTFAAGLPTQDINDLYSSGTDYSSCYIFAVANNNTVLVKNNSDWQVRSVTGAGANNLIALYCFAPNDIWVITATTIYRFNGNSWATITVTEPLSSVWGATYNQVWLGTTGTMGTPKTPVYFAPDKVAFPSSASGKLWNDGWFWDGGLMSKDDLAKLRLIIRKFKPVSMSCRYVSFSMNGMMVPVPIGNEYEEQPDGSIMGHYLSSFLFP